MTHLIRPNCCLRASHQAAMRGYERHFIWQGGKDFMVRMTFAPASLLPCNLSRNPVRPHRLGVACTQISLLTQITLITDSCKKKVQYVCERAPFQCNTMSRNCAHTSIRHQHTDDNKSHLQIANWLWHKKMHCVWKLYLSVFSFTCALRYPAIAGQFRWWQKSNSPIIAKRCLMCENFTSCWFDIRRWVLLALREIQRKQLWQGWQQRNHKNDHRYDQLLCLCTLFTIAKSCTEPLLLPHSSVFH